MAVRFKNAIIFCWLFLSSFAYTQASLKQDTVNDKSKQQGFPSVFKNKNMEAMLSIGVINGKVKDNKTNKGIPNASVFVFVNKFDTLTKTMKEKLLQSVTTSFNGDFSVEGLPLTQKIKLQITALQHEPVTQNVSFNFNMKDMQSAGRDMNQLLNATSKDLGDILLIPKTKDTTETLTEVLVNSKKTSNIGMQIFNVDKNLVTAGATAQELLKTIPMVNVDIEGNVTVRNAAPQIYVDGKPSTLSLDQIPADLIERVEIMTTPSAKYDAEGQGGILNIVLKRSQKLGVNGTLLLGSYIHMKPYDIPNNLYHYNGGLILNVRKSKINTFINALTFKRVSPSIGETDRVFTPQANGTYLKNTIQESSNLVEGTMYILRTGIDYFITNRTTLSADINYMTGLFTPFNTLTQSNTYSNDSSIQNTRLTNAENNFKNIRGSLGYKLTFEKQGKEFTANLFYNIRRMDFLNTFTNQYINPLTNTVPNLQQAHFIANSNNYRLQADYANPLSEEKKIEIGLTVNYNNTPFNGDYYKLNADKTVNSILIQQKYNYSDLNLSTYGTYTQVVNTWTFQVGARVEQFYYKGVIYKNDSVMNYLFQLPINLFPSVFVTKKLDDINTFQLSYTMRINRPSVPNLIPFIDYSDSTNLRKGNPNLKPEKIHIAEINYQRTSKNLYFLFALYGKYTENVITQYQIIDSATSLRKNLLINTFINSNYAMSYGAETVIKNTLPKAGLDFTTNFNVYNTVLNGGTNYEQIQGQRWSFYIKETINLKLPKGFSYQTFIEYQYTALVPPSSGNRSSGNNQMGGGQAFLGTPNSTSQGFIRPNFSVDMAIKKEFLKGLLTLTLAATDVFATKKYNAYTYSSHFSQNAWSVRNQSYYYLSLNMRLGKMDVNVMKKKNMKAERENMQAGNEGF